MWRGIHKTVVKKLLTPASPKRKREGWATNRHNEWMIPTNNYEKDDDIHSTLFEQHVTIYQSCCRGIPSFVSWSISRADESWWLLYTTQLVWLCIYDASQICADTSYAKTTALVLILIEEASVIATQHLKFFWASSQLYVNNITVVII